jgi:hypothetical protein
MFIPEFIIGVQRLKANVNPQKCKAAKLLSNHSNLIDTASIVEKSGRNVT